MVAVVTMLPYKVPTVVFCIWMVKLDTSESAGTRVNIALSKPVSSSNTAYGGAPERGNDGNGNTVWSENTCVMAEATAADPYSWWQVNVQALHIFESVAVTNRGDAFQWRLYNFTVSVYTDDPSTTPATEGKECAVYPGTVGAGVREEMMCAPCVKGQYLRIQKNQMLPDDALQFCEMEVFGTPTTLQSTDGAFFSGTHLHRLPGAPLSQCSGGLNNCAALCDLRPACFGFNFQKQTGTCHLMSNQRSEPEASPGWNWYIRLC